MTALIVPDPEQLAAQLAPARSQGATLALANGCFDLIHVGHVRLLAEARALADLLVVALNTDASVRANKGASRPLVPLVERMEILAALDGVTHVTSFGDETADGLIRTLRPTVLIKGTDRTLETVPERDTVTEVGGRIHICGDPKDHSSTALIEKLRDG